MENAIVQIDQSGRITLPKKVRERLGIQAGNNLQFNIRDEAIVLKKIPQKAGLVRKGKALVFSTRGTEIFTGVMVNTLLQKAREERELRIR